MLLGQKLNSGPRLSLSSRGPMRPSYQTTPVRAWPNHRDVMPSNYELHAGIFCLPRHLATGPAEARRLG